MATKYKTQLATVRRRIPSAGTSLMVESPVNQLGGQLAGEAVINRYITSGVLTTVFSTRSGATNYRKVAYSRFLMPPSKSGHIPKEGDTITLLTDGRKYRVESVAELSPDGYSLLYDVGVRNG